MNPAEPDRDAAFDDNSLAMNVPKDLPGESRYPMVFESPAAERAHRKARLAAALRLFGKYGFDEGVAGHVTVRDPEFPERFWVNPMAVPFSLMRVSDLLLVGPGGEVLDGEGILNRAAWTIHSAVHAARPDVHAVAHAHSMHGRAFSSLGRAPDPISQDACAFFGDCAVFADYTGVVLDEAEGGRIAAALGPRKACVLRCHGLLTAADTIEAAAWWLVSLERCCQAQLLAEAAGEPMRIPDADAEATYATVGTPLAGWFSFQPLYRTIVEERPELLD